MAGIGDITGTLEPGKCADMIVVEKNPLEDLRVLRNVDMVIVQGKVIRAPKVKKKQIVETELDKFLNCILMREYCIIKTMQDRKPPLHSFYF